MPFVDAYVKVRIMLYRSNISYIGCCWPLEDRVYQDSCNQKEREPLRSFLETTSMMQFKATLSLSSRVRESFLDWPRDPASVWVCS